MMHVDMSKPDGVLLTIGQHMRLEAVRGGLDVDQVRRLEFLRYLRHREVISTMRLYVDPALPAGRPHAEREDCFNKFPACEPASTTGDYCTGCVPCPGEACRCDCHTYARGLTGRPQ